MGCWWEPEDDDRYQDYEVFVVLPGDREVFDKHFAVWDDVIYDNIGSGEQDALVEAFADEHYGGDSPWSLSPRDQHRLASHMAYEAMLAERAAVPGTPPPPTEPEPVPEPTGELVTV